MSLMSFLLQHGDNLSRFSEPISPRSPEAADSMAIAGFCIFVLLIAGMFIYIHNKKKEGGGW